MSPALPIGKRSAYGSSLTRMEEKKRRADLPRQGKETGSRRLEAKSKPSSSLRSAALTTE